MRKRINRLDKEDVFNFYAGFVDNFKEYEKITKYQMYQALNALFKSDLSLIVAALTFEEILLFKEVCTNAAINSSHYLKLADNITTISLVNDLNFDHKNLEVSIDDEIVGFFKNLVIDEKLKEEKYYVNVVMGMIETYGKVYFKEFDKIYKQIRPEIYSHLPEIKFSEIKHLEKTLFYNDYYYQEDFVISSFAAYYNVGDKSNIDIIYSSDFYYNLFTYGQPYKYFDEFTYLFSANVIKVMRESLQESIQDNEDVVGYLYFLKNEAILTPPLKKLLDWPVWVFGGKSFNRHYRESQKSLLKYELREQLEIYHQELIKYANSKYHYLPISNEYNPRDSIEILNKALEEKDFMKKFINSQSFTKSKNVGLFHKAYRNAVVVQHGYAYKYEDYKLLVYANDKVYHVAGINNSILDNISKFSLPTTINLILLPFEDVIIYSFNISENQISYGKGIIDLFENSIASAKHIKSYQDIINLKH